MRKNLLALGKGLGPLILTFTMGILLGKVLSPKLAGLFYGFSLFIIDILLICLPFVVFSLILQGLLAFQQAGKFLLAIWVGATASNFLALGSAYVASLWILPHFNLASNFRNVALSQGLEPFFKWPFSPPVSPQWGLVCGMSLGLIASWCPGTPWESRIRSLAKKSSHFVERALGKIFMGFLPIYILGFAVKMGADGTFHQLEGPYGKILIFYMICVITYAIFLFFLARGWGFLKTLKSMGPTMVTSFSTMSSAASMPVNLSCTEKISRSPNVIRAVIPMTTNVHMMGDNFFVMIFGLGLLEVFQHPWPGNGELVSFAMAFCVAKLSGVGIPGASLLICLPVLEKYLHFDSQMLSIVASLYVLQDPFGTTANVLGNSAFALIMEKFFRKSSQPCQKQEGT